MNSGTWTAAYSSKVSTGGASPIRQREIQSSLELFSKLRILPTQSFLIRPMPEGPSCQDLLYSMWTAAHPSHGALHITLSSALLAGPPTLMHSAQATAPRAFVRSPVPKPACEQYCQHQQLHQMIIIAYRSQLRDQPRLLPQGRHKPSTCSWSLPVQLQTLHLLLYLLSQLPSMHALIPQRDS